MSTPRLDTLPAVGLPSPRPTWQPAEHPPTAATEKRCPTCLEVRPQQEYSRSARNRDGLADRCKPCAAIKRRVAYLALRNAALDILGGACRCCGQDRRVFLQIDHIHGDGAAHRREIARGKPHNRSDPRATYRWVTANPDEARRRCQILCANCNIAKETEESHTCP